MRRRTATPADDPLTGNRAAEFVCGRAADPARVTAQIRMTDCRLDLIETRSTY